MPPRTRTTLTELGVKRARPDPARHVEIHDEVTRGLVLWIGKAGGKSWFFVKSKDGARFRFSIGSYPSMSLMQARGKANGYSGQLEAGTLTKRRPKAAEAAAIRTVEDLKKAYIAAYKVDHKSWLNVQQDLDNHVLPMLGKRRPDKVKRTDIGDVLMELLESPHVHNKVKSHLSGMFKWAARRGIVDSNPAVGFEAIPTASRDRVLADDQLRAIWKACEKVGYPYGPYFQLLILLAQRRTETAMMDRPNIGDNSGVWEIPGERTKNGRAQLVPLPPLAIEIIKGIPTVETGQGPAPCLFPAPSRPANHFTTYSEAKEAIDKASGVIGWWLHDIRRTVSTNMAGLGVQPIVIEAVLNHASGQKAGVAGTYNRHAYFEEKRDALDKWAARLMKIVRPEA